MVLNFVKKTFFKEEKKCKKSKDINQEQLKKGIKIELEHTSSKRVARLIAMEHLKENSKYYKQASLKKVNKLISVHRKR